MFKASDELSKSPALSLACHERCPIDTGSGSEVAACPCATRTMMNSGDIVCDRVTSN